ncbi:MAG: PEP-CTERM sorting domain-containing protein [Lentisphaeria bacterium]
MNATAKSLLIATMGSCLVSGSANAAWAWENQTSWNNSLATPAQSTNYTFEITGTARTTWYWDDAAGIQFETDGWKDINSGIVKKERMKFQFSQPITSFQFTTPTMTTHGIYTGNALHWDMSTDNGATWTSLWSYTGTDNSYHTFNPQTLSAVQLATPTTQIILHYYQDVASYCAAVHFTGANGGSMTVTTIPEPAAASLLALAGLAGLARRRR